MDNFVLQHVKITFLTSAPLIELKGYKMVITQSKQIIIIIYIFNRNNLSTKYLIF